MYTPGLEYAAVSKASMRPTSQVWRMLSIASRATFKKPKWEGDPKIASIGVDAALVHRPSRLNENLKKGLSYIGIAGGLEENRLCEKKRLSQFITLVQGFVRV